MDLAYGPEYEQFRTEVREFVSAFQAGDPGGDGQRARFLTAAVERGFAYRSFPRRYGGSEQPFDPLRETIVADEFDASGLPWRLGPQSVGMIVPTLLEAGAPWQCEHFVPPTLRGEFVWCQGYSEPGAGSDLASLRSEARLEGDEWVINGHKVWTSDADHANYMFGMFRSEPDAQKHAGISYLLLEMDQPGIDVRPLRQINGAVHFYEVFFENARTPADWIVGERGQGWQVSKVNLKYERNLGGGSRMRLRFHDLLELARKTQIQGKPATQDAGVRQRLAEIEGAIRCAETMQLRQLSASANGTGADVVLPAMLTKLYGTNLGERIVQLAYDLIGAEGLRAPERSSWLGIAGRGHDVDWVDQYVFELASRIAAGSSNIQRNVIGERGLGLPRDLRAK